MTVTGTSVAGELRDPGMHTFIWPIFLECVQHARPCAEGWVGVAHSRWPGHGLALG